MKNVQLLQSVRAQVDNNDINQPIKLWVVQTQMDAYRDRYGTQCHRSIEAAIYGTRESAELCFDTAVTQLQPGDLATLYQTTITYGEFIDAWLCETEIEWTNRNTRMIEEADEKGESTEGAVILSNSWQTYVGYARNFEGLRIGQPGEYESDLWTDGKESTVRPFEEVLLTANDIEGLDDEALVDRIYDELQVTKHDWRWVGFKSGISRKQIAECLHIKLKPSFDELCELHNLPRSVNMDKIPS